MAFPEDIQSNTPAKYLFKLKTDTDPVGVICNPEPLEWASGSLQIKRDLEAGGVFTTFQLDSLTFVGNGAELLRNLFINAELNAQCTLIIYWWKSSTRAYVEFPTRFDINFNFYEIVKVGKFNFGVRVKAINNSTQTKLDSRQDIDVDITKLKSIGGIDIIEYPFVLKKGLHYDATDIRYRATLNRALSNSELLHFTNGTISYTSIPLDKVSGDMNQFGAAIQSVGYVFKQAQTSKVEGGITKYYVPLALPSFFKNALYDYEELEVNWMVTVHVRDRYVGGSAPWNIQILETKETNGVSEIITPYQLQEFGDLHNLTYYFHGTETVSCDKGNDLKFVIQSPGINAAYSAHLLFQQLIIDQRVMATVATLTEGFPIYDAMERVLQHIMDVQYPFYSEFFGRDEINYKDGVPYSSVPEFTESQLRFAHIQSGLNQRGLLLTNTDGTKNPLTLNFKDLFKSIKAIWNVGYSLETMFGESQPRMRIEEYAYFFQDVEILDLSDRVNKYDIQSQVMSELVPNDLKSGFNSFEYLSMNGRSEPNTTSQRTSIMNTASKFENISSLRGDTKGILDNLSNPIASDETIDTKGDSDLFIVKSQIDATYDWKPEKAENIVIDDETSLFKEDLLNRYFTPTRMLIRHGNKIKSGMMKYLTSVLRFQKTDKDSSLKTTGIVAPEIYTITESEDIAVSTLAAPIYLPMKHTVECLFTKTDLETLQANPLRYITFGESLTGEIITGYLLNLKMKNNEDKCELTIIERYIPPPA